MDSLVCPREQSLGKVTLVLGLLVWLVLILGTFGIALLYMLFAFTAYVFAQSAFIAYLRGTAVRLSSEQFPDLYARFEACCSKLGLAEVPEAYVLHGSGMLNAFATRFFGRDFVVLLADVVDALDAHPDGVNFYIGHELGHIRRKHLTGALWRWPVLWLPLVGASYSRARETTCDMHGTACSSSPENAARAMMLLSAGGKRWASANLQAYAQQVPQSAGFWASFHELISAYPWLTKRLARVLHGAQVQFPKRSPLAYVLALFVPFAGRLGSGAGFIILVAIISMAAAIGLPAYQGYKQRAEAARLEVEQRAELAGVWDGTAAIRQGLTAYYEKNEEPPESLAQAGVPDNFRGQPLEYSANTMTVTATTRFGTLEIKPRLDDNSKLVWNCEAGAGVMAEALPASCKE